MTPTKLLICYETLNAVRLTVDVPDKAHFTVTSLLSHRYRDLQLRGIQSYVDLAIRLHGSSPMREARHRPIRRNPRSSHMRTSHLPDNEHTVCQIGVFAAYVSRHGHAFIDRALYLPKAWTDDPARCQAAHVPADVEFSTKPRLAAGMIDRAIAVRVPFAWVAGDTVYGVGDIERDLRRAGKGYVLGVSSAHWFGSWSRERAIGGSAEEIAKALPSSEWQRLSAGAGTKGPRLHDWCYLELADLGAEEFNDENHGLWTRGLLIRRNIADGDLAYFTTWCPAGTSIETLIKVEGHRWTIEDSFETAKNEFGLDHNETRSWHGWHRHVSLVMLAFAMMAAIRHQANKLPLKKTKPAAARSHST